MPNWPNAKSIMLYHSFPEEWPLTTYKEKQRIRKCLIGQFKRTTKLLEWNISWTYKQLRDIEDKRQMAQIVLAHKQNIMKINYLPAPPHMFDTPLKTNLVKLSDDLATILN